MLDARGHEGDSYIIIPPCGEVVMRGLVTVLLLGVASIALPGQEVDWSANGRDAQGTRYSPASEITRTNVNRLAVAWTYRTGETDARFKTEKPTAFEATPLVVDGTMYLGTPLGRVIALDPATGRERWVFDPKIKRDVSYGDFASRGVSTWLDESAPAVCRRRIFVATAQSQLFALDARDGRSSAGFGRNGMVDLKAGLRIPPFEPGAYSMTSPPVVVNGLVITGSSIADNSRPNPASGEVRAYDARTGAIKWTWDPIPQDPKDPAFSEWRGAMAQKGGAANAWSVLAADAGRDLVFIPTGSAAPDYYGVLRLGDDRVGVAIVAEPEHPVVVWSGTPRRNEDQVSPGVRRQHRPGVGRTALLGHGASPLAKGRVLPVLRNRVPGPPDDTGAGIVGPHLAARRVGTAVVRD